MDKGKWENYSKLKRLLDDIQWNKFPRSLEIFLFSLVDKEALKVVNFLVNWLKNLTILDPAVGTGNFLLSAHEILLSIYRLLWAFSKDQGIDVQIFFSDYTKEAGWLDFNRFEVVQPLISRLIIFPYNLYGLDLNEEAVFISKLRILDTIGEFEEKKNRNLRQTPIKQLNFPRDYDYCLKNLQSSNTLTLANMCNLENFPQKFDLIVGNPPYGNLLSEEEKKIVSKYASYPKEISSVFVERCIDLNDATGNLVFIISQAIGFHKSLSKTRCKISRHYSETKVSTFDRDKCRLFEKMTQSTSILQCFNKKRKASKSFNPVFTTRVYRKLPDFKDMQYALANDALLCSKKVGCQFTDHHRLPKVGDQRFLLEFLLKISHRLDDYITGDGLEIWYRSSGNYWYNAWDWKPYDSSEMKILRVKPSLKPFILCLINSQLFYIWLRIYGDARHLNKDILKNVPVPSEQRILKFDSDTKNMCDALMKALEGVFDSDNNRFETSKIKSLLDQNDKILGKIYDFPPKDREKFETFIMNYDQIIHGGKQI